MKQIADVSIVVANYNNGKFLVEFMESINNSTMLPKELIIVDDGSEDDSKMILLNYNNPGYLKLIFFDENKGFTTALNKELNWLLQNILCVPTLMMFSCTTGLKSNSALWKKILMLISVEPMYSILNLRIAQ